MNKSLLAKIFIGLLVLVIAVFSFWSRPKPGNGASQSIKEDTPNSDMGTGVDKELSDKPVRTDSGGKTIDLSSKGLTKLPNELIGDGKVEILNLAYNQLESLPSQIQGWNNLRILDLEYNQLNSLPGEIRHLQNLEELDISGNGMTGLPAEIGQLKNLKVLRMSNNEFTGLPNELGNLKQLEVLDIEGNNLDNNAREMIRNELTNTQVRY